MLRDTPLRTKMIVYTVLGVFLILTASTAVIISTVTTQEEKLAYQQSVEMASNYANQFDADMKANLAIARTISTTMESYESADRDEALLILENVLRENPHLLGTYVAFEPDAFDGKDIEYVNAPAHDETGRFVPYWNKMNGTASVAPLLHYDTSDYYQLPKATREDLLTEPYFYEGVFMVSYVSPIIKDGEFVGIGGVDVSLDYVDEVVSEVRTFDTGYAFMVSNTGVLLSHPTHKDWIGKKRTFLVLEGKNSEKPLLILKTESADTLKQRILPQEKLLFFFTNPLKPGIFLSCWSSLKKKCLPE